MKGVGKGHPEELIHAHRCEQKKLICRKMEVQGQEEAKAQKSLLNKRLGKKMTLTL